MQYPARATVASTERALREAASTPNDEPLTLPLNFHHFGCGGEAALSQLIITWAQPRAPATLQTYVQTAEQVDDFVRRLPGLVGTLCASTILGGDQSGDQTATVRQAALTRLQTLQSEKPTQAYRGSSVEIVCADHIGRSAPYLLYLSDKAQGARLRPRSAFAKLAAWLLKRTVPEAYHPAIPAQTPDALGGMMYELFKNTEDHGQVDATGDILPMSIRAIKTLHHAIKPEILQQIVAEDPPLAQFCQSLRPPEGAVQTHLFELSVMDSGPGFAVTRTGRPLDEIAPGEEEAAVRDCFTRFSSKGGSRYGQGLPHVLRVLRQEGGFLRLRTGRVSLHANFSIEGTGEETAALELFRPEGDALAPVAGSVLTVLLPLRRGA